MAVDVVSCYDEYQQKNLESVMNAPICHSKQRLLSFPYINKEQRLGVSIKFDWVSSIMLMLIWSKRKAEKAYSHILITCSYVSLITLRVWVILYFFRN